MGAHSCPFLSRLVAPRPGVGGWESCRVRHVVSIEYNVDPERTGSTQRRGTRTQSPSFPVAGIGPLRSARRASAGRSLPSAERTSTDDRRASHSADRTARHSAFLRLTVASNWGPACIDKHDSRQLTKIPSLTLSQARAGHVGRPGPTRTKIELAWRLDGRHEPASVRRRSSIPPELATAACQ